jgi:vacuolar-type H+-ATPase subunit I/STV1
MKTATLDRLIWVLIYGGLLVLVLGLFVQERVFGFGFSLIVFGGITAAVGAALIVVRSRIEE